MLTNSPFCDTAFSTAADEFQNEASGAVPLVETQQHSELGTNAATPRQLLDGGHHFDDIGLCGRYNRQQRYNYISTAAGILLPRDRLHSLVVETGVTRPTPQPSRQ